jgi:DNA-binding response OmpR family regulator
MTKNNIKILIVDDEVDSCHFIQKALVRRGFDVDVAFEGREALENIGVTTYDFIFLDFYMPGLTGIEVAKVIKGKDVKSIIVLTSGYLNDSEMNKDTGISEFLEKPFSLEEIEALIAKYKKRGK